MRADRKRATEFGKRRNEKVEPTKRKPTVLDRFKNAGMRWWTVGSPRKATTPRGKGFRRTQLAP
jgi:hypothetical protein